MGEASAIEWTTNTWNPWQGCDHVSPGCANCYMYSEKRRYGQDPEVVIRSKPATFRKPLTWQRDHAARTHPLIRPLVFTCSWSDFFHKDADPWRDEAWSFVKHCPDLIFQILTKRIGLVPARLPPDWGEGYPNVWLGVSAEDAEWWDRRVPALAEIPAAVRFVSYEPALGPVPNAHLDGIDWVIAGSESGNGARPANVDWYRSMRDQCVANAVKFFYKQHARDGVKFSTPMLDGRKWVEWPAGYGAAT